MLDPSVAVLEPGTPEYEAAYRPAMARFHHIRPRAVVRAASAEDVARTLAAARRSGVHVVPRGGGHCAAGRSTTDGIVLDLSPMRAISMSPAGLVTIGAGARLAQVYDTLHDHGLTLPAGCGPTVGIAGLTLGGGIGVLGRRYGLTCDRLRGARVVLADGRIVDCAADREPDLFWALRGAGGGQFGVVTSFVFEPVPEPETTRFVLTWPGADAAAVVAAWQEWAPDAPDELNAAVKIAAADSVHAIVFGAVVADGAAALLDELVARVGSRPVAEVDAGLSYRDLKRSLDGIGPAGEPAAPVTARSEFFRRSLPSGAIDELLDVLTADRPAGQVRELNLMPMGGAYNRVAPAETAFAHRAERFLLEHVAADARWVRRSWAAAHPWGAGRVYPNFPDPDLTDWAFAYHGENHARLVEVKHAYDPDRMFRFPQSL